MTQHSSPQTGETLSFESACTYWEIECDLTKCLFLVARSRSEKRVTSTEGAKMKQFAIRQADDGSKLRHVLKSFEKDMKLSMFLREIAGFMGLPGFSGKSESASPTSFN